MALLMGLITVDCLQHSKVGTPQIKNVMPTLWSKVNPQETRLTLLTMADHKYASLLMIVPIT